MSVSLRFHRAVLGIPPREFSRNRDELRLLASPRTVHDMGEWVIEQAKAAGNGSSAAQDAAIWRFHRELRFFGIRVLATDGIPDDIILTVTVVAESGPPPARAAGAAAGAAADDGH
jgi:hypothetical protein